MTGRADRKFCSSACRQKFHRDSSRTRNVTAEPFEVADIPPARVGDDSFWSVMIRVHNELQMIDPEFFEDDDPQVVSVNPPRVRGADWERVTAEFLQDYDTMIELMARARATVQVIRDRNGWA